ncbi:hemicentin-1-like isoform X2 [Mya arenaria]|uniref:hemicentin-1-like isoform X2 n=1 Tax=Mya arenaria TaxID=6604 RepID=UPI0022E09E9F|nr:hemicentin-1-like isoform X2 [Mya arenaria]
MFDNYIFVIVLVLFFTVNCQECERLVSLPAKQPVLRYEFNFSIPDVYVQLENPNGTPIFQAFCTSTTCQSAEYINSTLDPSGDIATGKFHIKLNSFGGGQQGNYTLWTEGRKTFLKCIKLYLLGKPRPSNIIANRVPYEGEAVILTCHSISTTDPPGHDLVMSYTWTEDGTMLTSGGRFTLLPNTAATLTITKVQQSDELSQFACTGTEELGLPSDSSAAFQITVYYGPDNIAFNSTGISQAVSEGDSFPPVACLADCKPSCIFRWTKDQSSVSTSAVLDLGIVGSDDMGIYTCTGTHSVYTTYTDTKTYSVTVTYGPNNVSISPSTTSYTTTEGDSQGEITCSAVCNPECAYTWSKVGATGTVRNNAILNLGQLTRQEAGSYICSASNPSSSTTRTGPIVVVEVIYGPSIVSLSPSTTSYTKPEGGTLGDITCSAVCHLECVYTWSKIGTTRTGRNNAILNLGQLTRQEAGSYICTATNPSSSTTRNSSTVVVNVIFGPNTSLINPSNMNYTINENQPIITIVCSASCYPTCTYSWRKTTPTPSSASNNHNLALGEVTRNEAGTYQCEATNPTSNETATSVVVNINVRYGPDSATLGVPSKYTTTEGDTLLNVTCSSVCWPGCSYTWRNLTNNAIMSQNRSLTFGPVDRYMTDTYRCDVANIYTAYNKTTRSELQLLVKYAPDVSIVQSASSLTEGSPLILTCSANGYPSQYTYTGFNQTFGTTAIPNDNTEEAGVRDNISVRIASLALQDTGLYTCTVHNNVKDINDNLIQSESTQIDVKVKPQTFLAEDRFAAPTGGQVNISVPIYSNPVFSDYGYYRYDGYHVKEDDKYEFTQINALIQTQFYGRSVTLQGLVVQMTIQNLTEVDFGLYTFWIKNEIGNTSVEVNVSARSIPSQPMQLNVTVNENTPSFEWRKGFNGGFVQTFLLQTSSTSDTQLWTNRTSILETDTTYIGDTGFYRVNITKFEFGHFDARLIAYNELGNADPAHFQPFDVINMLEEEQTKPSNGAIIGAATGGGLAGVLLLGAAVFFLVRRRPFTKGQSKEDRNALKNDHALKGITEPEDDDIPDEVENAMYVGAGEAANVYSKPVKKTTSQVAQTNPGDIYAVVDKPKGKKKKR